jgi:hypothetical protein
MGETCITHPGDEKCIQNLGRKHEAKQPLGRLGIDCRTILKWLQRIGHEDVDLDSTGSRDVPV